MQFIVRKKLIFLTCTTYICLYYFKYCIYRSCTGTYQGKVFVVGSHGHCSHCIFMLTEILFMTFFQVPSPKRKLEEPVLEFRPPRGAITQPLKKLKINVFKVHKCAVCGFTTENLLQFHEHIPQHKSDGSSYQCRECGLCYTSHVSLSRHLFIVHKLKEPQPVSKQNGSREDNQQENKPNHEDELSDNTVLDRRCKVCAKTFETEAALNTHMRTHGMAFIKSKRMSSAEK